MMVSFLEGFVLGLGAAVPLGPINILIINEAITRYKNGVALGFGAMSADVTYLILILFSVMTYLNQPIILNLLSVFGGLFLVYLAYTIFKKRDVKIDISMHEREKSTLLRLYLKGFLLTFVNPYTIAFWLSVSGYVAAKDLNASFVMLGLLGAILGWITMMPYFVHKNKDKITQKISYAISLISSLILLGFGIMMFINLLVLMSKNAAY